MTPRTAGPSGRHEWQARAAGTRGRPVRISRCAGRGRRSDGPRRAGTGCRTSAGSAWSGPPGPWAPGEARAHVDRPRTRRLLGVLGRLGGGHRLRGGAAGTVAPVHRLLGDTEGGAHRVPREAERTVEVDGGRDQGLDAVPQLLGETDGRGGGTSVDDEARGGAGASRAVDVAQLGGEGAQCVHLPADPLDVPHQQVQAGPSLGVVGCVVGHEQASRTGVERNRAARAARCVNSFLTNVRVRSWSRGRGVGVCSCAPSAFGLVGPPTRGSPVRRRSRGERGPSWCRAGGGFP